MTTTTPKPGNYNKPWGKNDLAIMTQLLSEHKSLDEIATAMSRSIGGIKAALKKSILAKHHVGETPEHISEQLFCDIGLVKETILAAEKKKNKKVVPLQLPIPAGTTTHY